MQDPVIADYVAEWGASQFADTQMPPWHLVQRIAACLLNMMPTLGPDYSRSGDVAVHRSATVEAGAVLKGPCLVGPDCFVGTGAYLRGGVYLAEECKVGPGSELKSTIVFERSTVAHFNFVGDSIVGSDVNLEAGAVVANHRNECATDTILISHGGGVIDTGVLKFGSLIGDRVRIGANAVIAPGALLTPGTIVGRLRLVDQRPTIRR